MPKTAPRAGPARMSSYRLSAETLALIDALAADYSPGPGMTVTKTAILETAVRELAERRLKGKKKSGGERS